METLRIQVRIDAPGTDLVVGVRRIHRLKLTPVFVGKYHESVAWSGNLPQLSTYKYNCKIVNNYAQI